MSAVGQLRRCQERWESSCALTRLREHEDACPDCGGHGPAKRLCPQGVTLRDAYWDISLRGRRSPEAELIQLTIFDLDLP